MIAEPESEDSRFISICHYDSTQPQLWTNSACSCRANLQQNKVWRLLADSMKLFFDCLQVGVINTFGSSWPTAPAMHPPYVYRSNQMVYQPTVAACNTSVTRRLQSGSTCTCRLKWWWHFIDLRTGGLLYATRLVNFCGLEHYLCNGGVVTLAG